MSDRLFGIILVLFMASDPSPLTADDHNVLTAVLNANSKLRGHNNWVDAYHSIWGTKGRLG